MKDLQKYRPNPHTAKEILLKKHGLSLSEVSHYLERDYHYTSKVLSGTVQGSKWVQVRLRRLVNELEGIQPDATRSDEVRAKLDGGGKDD